MSGDAGSRLYSVRFSAAAAREFKKLERSTQERLDDYLRQLEADPRRSGCKKIQPPHLQRYRYRVGDFRVVYEIDDAARFVDVLTVADRKETY